MNLDPMHHDDLPAITVPDGTTCTIHAVPGGVKFFVKAPNRSAATDATMLADMRARARAMGYPCDSGMDGPYYYDVAGNNVDDQVVFRKGAAGIQVGCVFKFNV